MYPGHDSASVEAARQRALAAFELFRVPEQRVEVASVWMRDGLGSPWFHAVTHMHPTQDPVGDKLVDTYQDAVVVLSRHPRADVSELLKRFLESGIAIRHDQLPTVRLGAKAGLNYTKAEHWSARWPLFWMTVEAEGNRNRPRRFGHPFTSLDQPPFSDSEQFIRHWTGFHMWRADHSAMSGLVVSFPDMRGQVDSVETADGAGRRFEIQIRPPENDVASVQCRVSVDGESFIAQCVRTAKAATWEATLPVGAQTLQVFAVDAQGHALHVPEPMSVDRLAAVQASWPSQDELAELLRQPESHMLDFKSWQVVHDYKSVRDNVLRAITAFANADGGRVVVGVNDARTPDGPDLSTSIGSAPALPNDAVRAARLVQDALEKELEPTPNVHASFAHFRGRVLLMLDVKKGIMPPYGTGSGRFYVRRGAKTEPARPHEIRQLLLGENL